MSATPQIDDEALVARALGPGADDREALGELISRHLDSLLSFFMVWFHNRAVSEDLVQEVCLRVVRSRQNFGPPHRFRPWLWTIAHNVARRARSAFGRGGRTLSLDSQPPKGSLYPEELLVDDAPSPRHRAQEIERRERLWRALDQLDEGQRDVVILKGLQEIPCQEVAQILGVSEGTVWSRFHRALTRLRGLMSLEGDEL